jgi:hypothetical protein
MTWTETAREWEQLNEHIEDLEEQRWELASKLERAAYQLHTAETGYEPKYAPPKLHSISWEKGVAYFDLYDSYKEESQGGAEYRIADLEDLDTGIRRLAKAKAARERRQAVGRRAQLQRQLAALDRQIGERK